MRKDLNHRIIEYFELNGTFKGHLVSAIDTDILSSIRLVAQSPIQPDLEHFQ